MRKKEPEINLHLGCSLQAMREMTDNHYDLAIVDPPYGLNINLESGRGGGVLGPKSVYKKKEWDKAPDKVYFDELLRVSKHQIIWGANHFIQMIPINSSCWIVWDKMNGQNDFADCELAWTSFKTAVRQFRFRWQGMLQGDMKNKEKRIHPTQKPTELYKWLLENYAKDGDKILDTHLGSGSIACACYDLGFDLDAWEIDKDYYRDTLVRYNNYSKQIKLF